MIKVMLDDGAFMPVKAHREDAGFDLKSKDDVWVFAYSSAIFDTGVHVQIPEGYVGLVLSKSGLNFNHGILSDGVIDCGYTGTIKVKLYNHSPEAYKVRKGDKISQLVIMPISSINEMTCVASLEETERGVNGFGSTGR